MRGSAQEPRWVEIELEVDDHRVARRPAPRRVDSVDDGPGHPARPWTIDHPRRMLAGAIAVLALVAVVSFGAGRAGREVGNTDLALPSASASPSTTPATTESVAPARTLPPITTSTVPPTTQPLIAISELGGYVLRVAVAARLVGLTDRGDVAVLDLDSGRLVVTDLDQNEVPRGEATVLALDSATVVQPWAGGAAIVVPRLGQPAMLDLGRGDRVAVQPGPLPDTLWTMPALVDQPGTDLELVGLDGQALGPRMVFERGWPVGPFGAGGVLIESAGGTYLAAVEGVTRLSPGRLVGRGTAHIVVEECDEALRCDYVVVDVVTGERSVLPEAGLGDGSFVWDAESISPDGGAMAVYSERGTPFGLRLLDLDTGELTPLSPTRAWPGSVAWSPDGRFLLYRIAGDWAAFDRAAGTDVELPPDVPRLERFVVVPAERPT